MRKAFLVMSIMLLVFAAVTACSAAPETYEIPDFDVSDGSEIPDFNGYSFVFVQEDCHDFPDSPFYYEPDSTFFDLLSVRIAQIESLYNCTLEFDASKGYGSNMYSLLRRCLASGLDFGDYGYGSSSNYNFTSAVDGLYLPMSYFSDYIDTTDSGKFGTPNLQECCMYKGVPHGVVPAALPLKLSASTIPLWVVNEKLIHTFGMVDPRDVYESGNWTLDYFEEHMADYSVSDGTSVKYPLLTDVTAWTCGYLGAYGCRFVYDSNGKCESLFRNPVLVDALTRSIGSYHAHKDYIGTTGLDGFYGDDGVLYDGLSREIEDIAKKVDEFGVVPFPRSELVKDGRQNTYFGAIDTLSITATSKEPEAAAFILNELLDPFPGYEANGIRDLLLKTTFFDVRDVEVYLNRYRSSCYNYHAVEGHSRFSVLFTIQRNVSPNELIQKNESCLDSIIEEYIMDNYFGCLKQYWDSME